MNILHVGWGFQPFRTGGLIEYAEDLMEIQVSNGYEVNYFCTGRFTIGSKKPFLKNWQNKKGYTVYEVWNPPVISGFENGIENPLADVNEAITAAFFLNVVRQLSPDIIHIQEFLGFPTSLLAEIKLLKIKTVFTVEDYYYLCPTIRLVLPDGQSCRIKGDQLGRQCKICCQNAPKNNLYYKLQNVYPLIFNVKTVAILKKIKDWLFNKSNVVNDVQITNPDESKACNFKERREYNLDLLPQIDLVIAMSQKVADIFNYYKPLDNLITLNLTLKHIDDIKPDQINPTQIGKINFGLINVLTAPIKGRDLIMELFKLIDAAEWKSKVEFVVMGRVDTGIIPRLNEYDFVKLTGRYDAANLSEVLENLNINVGIVPSVWEEAYGFVGIEFLAKGIPVIGNDIGGIPDYVTKETGWLNKTCDAYGLFNIVNELVGDTNSINRIRENLIVNRSDYIKTINTHFNEMNVIYQRLLGG